MSDFVPPTYSFLSHFGVRQIPWALRGLVSDPRCQELFGREFDELRAQFDNWQPKTAVLKEVRRKLEPIRGRRSRFAPASPSVVAHGEPSGVKR
jgi:hypothetical protein